MKIKIINESGRIDKVLAEKTAYSRSQLADWLKNGHALVNQHAVKGNYKVKTGDLIEINVPEVETIELKPENLPLEIVYQDSDVAVANKPQGMVVHPAAGHPNGTLVNALMYHIKDLSGINGELRPGIVHRIDRDTSGLLMIAKNDYAHHALSEELREKSTERQYLAIVHGTFQHDRGKIEAPIGRDPKNRQKQAVVAGGRTAITHFEVIERFESYTLVRLKLETGRTHQIRVHMQYINHPVAGDPLYAPHKTLKGNGQFLHAGILGFTHPKTGEVMHFEAPVPEIFQKTLDQLRRTENE
ncbi:MULTISPECIES: RluA family pseudouridine synthase [unclassified Enterococcus]|uniref:RluA family pseudouridine synthase n=1 Tax=unclassified Enterococcus TaxID=2608891 RepID=UPI001553AB34|nr:MULTISPECIES: RluA family pseudouridine synthase [unclassified Enterococcus]MBS7576655.1 RluA family pseudouridine synthase [Enterococcus sp. MMGLQ5-2]MBS7583858.1 RluA family pseudouridine synthase [Enterococcus sp. MMGLQ5-1]NPD11719.1 RluA family pseudouridine synthase [Enterococcus sp. MMGLQ5-1]NPD36492.1 RluA family pseudouridine synthase [Enterococcus sp. MMGLQ5-2]